MDEVRSAMTEMLAKLGSSHYAIIPKELYAPIDEAGDSRQEDAGPGITPMVIDGQAVVGSVAPDSPAERAGVKPGMVLESINREKVDPMLRAGASPGVQERERLIERSVTRKLDGQAGESVHLEVRDGDGSVRQLDVARASKEGKLVSFGNLPATRLDFESKVLAGGAGYIRFNLFLDPVSIMPRLDAAIQKFAESPGIILDLRGNPGGIGIMAMGVAGFFVSEPGRQLGTMKMRDATLKFAIFPRPEVYTGALAILVDAGSASTTEILAQGLQDLGRARIFGTRTAGAALPSDIVRLPNGDGFQFAQASYTSEKGEVLEGSGVTPDVEVRQTREALAAGRDPAIEAAEQWIQSLKK